MTMGLSGLGVQQSGSLRKENEAIILECASCLDGSLRLLSEEGATAPADISVREILELRKRNPRKMKLGYEYDVSENLSLFPELETSWSNVEYYDQTNEPMRWLGWALVPGGFLTVAGTLVMILADVGSGLAMLLPGVALDAFGVIQLVKSPTTDRFGPEGQPRRAPPPATKKKRKEEALDREPEAKPEPGDDLEEEPAPVEKVEKKEEEPAPVEKVEKKEEEPAPVEKVEKKEKKTKKAKKKDEKDEGFDDFLL